MELTQAQLKELLDYDPETGVFSWRFRGQKYFCDQHTWRKWNTRRAGKEAGYHCQTGYVFIRVAGRLHRAHRLAWLYVYGKEPTDQLDHINGDRKDNRIANLREVDNTENKRNMGVSRRNTSGVVGVGWHNATGKWRAHISSESKGLHLGVFDSLLDAVAARKSAEQKLGYHQNHASVRAEYKTL